MEFKKGLLPTLGKEDFYTEEDLRKKDYSGNHYERRIPKSVIISDKYQKLFKNSTTLYEFLWANIIRGKMISDKYNILEEYYIRQQKLACTFSYRFLSKKLDISHHTIKKYIEELKEAKVILTSQIKIGGCQTQTVYILGYWKWIDEKKIEVFHFDETFG